MSIIIHLGRNFLQNVNSFIMFSDCKNSMLLLSRFSPVSSLQVIQKIQKNRKNNYLQSHHPEFTQGIYLCIYLSDTSLMFDIYTYFQVSKHAHKLSFVTAALYCYVDEP